MTDPSIARAFLEAEVESLEPFASVGVCPAGAPLQVVEVTRREDQGLEVRVPGRPPIVPPLSEKVVAKLGELGFASEAMSDPMVPWICQASDASAAVDLALRVLGEAFEAKPGVSVDVIHGDHRAEHEARLKLAALREKLEAALLALTKSPLERDDDGDYVLPVQDVHVTVAPRMMPGGMAVVRIFAITNVGVAVTPELGLFLARLNFGLMFGRFALDAEHRSIWFDEALVGDQLNNELLDFTIKIVASTADEWDDRLKQMFGGNTYQELLKDRERPARTTKPGQGGYL